MPLAIREQVLAAILTTLEGVATAGAVTGLTTAKVHRNRDTEIEEFPALVLIDGDHSADADSPPDSAYDLAVTIEGYVQAASAATLGPALNLLYAEVIKALAGEGNPPYGGLAQQITERALRVELNRGDQAKPEAAFELSIEVRFYTRYGNPYSQA